MTRSRLAFLLVSLAVLAPLLGGALVLGSAVGEGAAPDSLYRWLSVFTDVFGLVRNAYVEPTEAGQLMDGAMEGVGDALDPFSAYLPPGKMESFLAARERAPLRSGLAVLRERGVVYVAGVAEGSPAAAAEIEPGDIVAKLLGRSTREMPIWEVVEILADKPGSRVDIEVIRRGKPRWATLELAELGGREPELTETRGLPVLRIAHFDGETTSQVEAILRQLAAAGKDRLIVDLRGVVGGAEEAAYAVADLLTGAGDLGNLLHRQEIRQRFPGHEGAVWEGSLVVLVDGSAQGAPEILAAVLRERAQARLVGQETFGYAGEQEVLELADGARLLLTTQFYTGPGGTPLSDGLTPDVEVDEASRAFNQKDVPLRDLILERALDLLLNEEEKREAA